MSDQLLNQFVTNFKAKFPAVAEVSNSSNTEQAVVSEHTKTDAKHLPKTESTHRSASHSTQVEEPVERVGFFRRILNWILSKMFSS